MRDLAILLSVLAGLAGLAGGGVAGLQARPPSDPPADTDEAPAEPCARQVDRIVAEAARLQAEKERLDGEITRSRRARAAVRGMVRPWPDTPPDPLTEQAISEHLDTVLDGSNATLEELDCEAYPCVAVLSWRVPEQERDLVDAGDGEANLSGALLARLSQGPYRDLPFWHTGRLVGDDRQASVHAFTWLDPQDYSDAKGEEPEQALVDGTVLDAAHGRTEEVLETWLDTEGPGLHASELGADPDGGSR